MRTQGRWLVVTSSLAMVLLGAGCGSGSTASTSTTTSAPANLDAHHLELGETGVIDYTIHNVPGTFSLSVAASHLDTNPTVLNPVSPSSGPIPPATGDRWITVDLSLHTDSSHGYQGSVSGVALVGSNGQRYADDPGVTVPHESPEAALYRVPPRSTVTDVVIFEVPQGVDASVLRFTDTSSTSQSRDTLAWYLSS